MPGADVIVVAIVVIVVVSVVVAGITSSRWKRYIRSGPRGDNAARKGSAEINPPDR